MSRRELLLESCEDRILCDAAPDVALSVPTDTKIGDTVQVTATFDNTSPTDTGFGPYIDLFLDTTGADGAGAAVDDGISFVNATYLGQPVTANVLTFDALGNATHPYAKDAAGNALIVNAAAAGYGPGDQLIVLQLPFGSFSPTQPPAAVTINLQMSNLADANTPLNLSARGGFQYGNDALDNPATDPSIVDPTLANASITPQLFTLKKIYLGPEDETATGPNFIRQYRLEVDVATGQTITNLQLSDLLPAGGVNGALQFVSVDSLTGGTENVGARVTPSTTTPGGTLSRTLNSVTGVAGVDATLTFSVYVPRVDSASAVIINANSGDDVNVLNNASTSGNWVPIDVRDTTTAVSINPAGPEHTLVAKSIATQKSVAIVTDTGATGATPGDVLEYTIQVQVSDYFAFQNLVLTDLFSDGQRFDASFAPTLTWVEHGVTYSTQNFGNANYTVAQNFTGATASLPVFTIDPAANDGTTKVTFNLSGEMALRPGADGKLVGGAIPNGGTGGPVPPSNPPLPFGATTATIKFRTIIQDAFSDDFPSGNASLNPRDVLTNGVTVAGDLLQVGNVTTVTGQSEADTSGASVSIVNTTVSKSIYAVNGNTNLASVTGPAGQILVRPGDTMTYRLRLTVPTGDIESLLLSDYLPLPIFSATEITSFVDTISATAPVAGTAKFGPTETLRAVRGVAPTLTTAGTNNLVVFNYGTTDDPTNTPRQVDILFTVTVSGEPFADALFLTNQVQASESNTQQPSTVSTSNAIIQVQLQEPAINAINKGVVGYNNTGLTLGGIAFNAPGGATTFSGGPIATTAQATAIGASDLLGGLVDAGDAVRFALVLQNTGRSDAYDVSFKDQIINPGFSLPAGATDAARLTAINFALRRGDGTLLANGTDYTATLSAGGLLTVTMIDNYNAGAGDVGLGGVSRGFNANTATLVVDGSNTIVATYDLTLAAGVIEGGATITNTATLTNYSGKDGGTDFSTTDPTDTASVRTPRPTLAKVLTGTEVTTGNNSNTQAVIGELVTYTLTLTVPEGSVSAAQIADTLDAGLAFVDVTSVTLSAGLSAGNTIGTGTAPTNVTVTGSGRNLNFNLGTLTNSNTNNAVAETVTIVYRAVVLNSNSAPNIQSGTLLNNAAAFSGQYTDRPTGTVQSYTGATVSANNVTIIEPALNVAKGVASVLGGPFNATLTNVDAGDAVFYQIQITNTAGQPTAFDLFLNDAIPAALGGLSVASVTTSGFGATPAPVAGDFQIAGNVLSIDPAGPRAGDIDVPGGATLTIVVQGALTSAVQPNQTINNNATIRWTSLDGTFGTRSIYSAVSTERSGGTLTPAANTNASTNDTILDNYAATSATAAITILNPIPTKTIDATSESSTTNVAGVERVAIGEIVRYRLTWQIPEGTSTNLVVTDLLPVGLQFLNDGTATLAFVSSGGNISSSVGTIGTLPNLVGNETTLAGLNPTFVIPAAQISGGAFGSGTDPIFTLGTISNPDSDANQEFIVVEFNASVLNISANQRFNNVSGADSGAVDRANQVTYATGTSSQTSTSVAVRVTEPSITNVAKTVSAGPYDAGNVVTYTVTFANVNSVDAATAFDVVMTDVMPAFLTAVTFGSAVSTGSVTGLSGSVTGNTLTVNAASMAPGATVTITYTATLASTVPAGQIVTNTARVTYTSLPGTGTDLDDGVPATTNSTPGAAGTATGERTGAGGEGADGTILNNYADSAARSLTVATPTLDKTFKDGSITNDDTSVASSTGASVVVGEQVTYDILVTLPEGVTQALNVIDAVPTGLRVDGFQILTTTAAAPLLAGNFNGSFTTTPASTTFTGPGNLTLSFGNTTVTNDNVTTNNSFVIRVQATVLNILANQGTVTRTNTATLNYTNPNTAVTATVTDSNAGNDPTVTVVEPAVVTTKTVSDSTPDSSDVISYTITLSNTSGQTAYDIALNDVLPGALVSTSIASVAKTGTILINGVSGTPVAGVDVVLSGGVLQFATDIDMPTGSSITIVVNGTVASSATPNLTVTNTATTRWTSVDGTVGDERTGADGVGGALNDYASSSSVNFTVPAAAFAKQLVATSAASTTGSNVTIGETATYALIVTLPEGTTPGLTVTDLLPPGLQYVSSSVIWTTAADPTGILVADFGGTPTAPTVTGGVSAGDDVTFTFGSISVTGDNNATNNQFLILVTARVLDVAGNVGTGTQTVLPNAATFDIPGDLIAPFTTPNVNITVVEPRMTITKDIVQASGDAGDTLTITLTANNTGTSTAFDTTVEDTLDLSRFDGASVSFSSTAAGFSPSFNIGSGLVQFSGGTIAVGGSAVFTFTVALRADLQPGQTISNTASVTQATTLPGVVAGERNEPTVNGSDTISVPKTLTLVKSLVSTNVASSAGSSVVVGENATFRLDLSVQDGVTPQITVTDSVPAGLGYVTGSAVFRSADGVTATGAVSGTVYSDGVTLNALDITNGTPGGTLVFRLVNVTAPASPGIDTDAFQIDYTLVALNVVGNQGGVTRTNGASATSPALSLTTPVSSQTLTVVEPALTVGKSISAPTPDAGDIVSYTITLTNTSGQTAYDVALNDVLPASFGSPSITSVTKTGTILVGGVSGTPGANTDVIISGGTLQFAGGSDIDMPTGSSLTIVVSGTIQSTVTPTQLVTNTANAAWTSTDGANANERSGADGVGGVLNDYAASASASYTVPAATLTKTLFATSEASTGGSSVTIGETVTYALKVTLPEGTTPNLTLVDVLPAGLQYVSHSLVTDAASSGGLLAADFGGTVAAPVRSGTTGSGDDQTFTFGSIDVTGDNAATNNSFLVLVTAQVLNVPGNVGFTGSQTVLPNTATLDITGDSAPVITTAAVNVTVVEPKMTITKNIDLVSADAGDTVTVTLVVTNTGTSNAYDVIVNDPFPAGKFTNFTEVSTSGIFAFGTSGDTVTFTSGTINVGASATFIFTAVLTSAVAPGEVLNNTASVTQATTLPGTVAGERTEPVVNGSDSVAVPIGSYAKSLFATSDANTGTNNVRIGETITYALKVTLPEGTTSNLSVVDLLPAGLQYVSHSVFTSASGSNGLLAADFAGSITGPVRTGTTGDGDDQTFAFSTISVTNDNVGNNNSFLLLVTARVTDVAGNVGTTGSQTTLNNQATFDIPTDGSPLFTTPNVPAVVVEPRLQITKSTSDTTPDPGQVLTYTLNITHTVSSTAIAYDVLLRDAIPTGLTLDTGSIQVNGTPVASSLLVDANSSTGSLLDLKFTELAVGGTITITYTAQVSTSTALAGAILENTAKIYWDTDPAEDTNVILSGGSDGTPDRDFGAVVANEVYNVNTDPAQDTERVVVNANTISGTVYRDLNANGSFGGADTGISGVTVNLDGTDINGNVISRTTVTNGSGAYSFSGLTPGAYIITEVQPVGLTDALETVGSNFGGAKSDVLDSNTITGVTILAQSNATGAGYNFGEVLPSSVAGSVYYDANNDGVRQGGETGLGLVPVRITGTDVFGQAVSTDGATDGSGNFIFNNAGAGLRPGSYTLVELTQPAGYFDGKETAGTAGGSTATNEQIGPFTLAANTAATGYLFGELLPASLSGGVYVDANNDGIRGGAEVNLANVTIGLSGTDDLGSPVNQTTTTDVNGNYSFANLRPGTYVLTEIQPVGYLDGRETAGTQTGTVNNTANSQTISAIPLTAGTNGTGNNFGELLASSLAGTVYRDLNNDGVIDVGETGISGVTVELTGTDDRGAGVTISTTTDVNGNYSFTVLRPGTYTITETTPAGFLDGIDTIGTPGGTAGNDVFGNIVLASNTAGINNNFGELPPSGLSGFAYIDANNNGLFEVGETAQIGNTITLTGTDDLSNPVTLVTTTTALGFYEFTNVRPGTYTLTQTQNPALLDGKETAGTLGGTVTNGADSQTIAGIVLGTNDSGVNNNFGDLRPASLAGFVYSDLNNDGLFGGAELGITGATVQLTGTDDRGQSVNVSGTTLAGGGYTFADLRPGTYTLTETTPVGYLDGKDTIGTPGGVAANDVFSGIVITEGTAGANNNFGELLSASLAGTVYEDDNNDGVKDPGEAGIQGVGVRLTGTDDLGGTIDVTATTDPSGNYVFLNLRPGSYLLTQTQPGAYLDGKETAGTQGGTVDNAVVSQTISTITLGANVAGTGNNFGELRPASLSGAVYADLNGDGIKDAGESGLRDVTVTLTGTDDLGQAVSLTGTTDATGAYSFTGLRPGQYALAETQPADYADGAETLGTGLTLPNTAGTVGADIFTGIQFVSVAAGNNVGSNYNFGEQPVFNPAKSLVTTSVGTTLGNDVTIGETAKFRLVVNVPQGTLTNFQIQDVLPAGYAYVTGSARVGLVSASGQLTSTLVTAPQTNINAAPTGVPPGAAVSADVAADVDVYGSGTDIYFKFGTVTNADADGSTVEAIVIEFEALVLNEAGVQAGGALANTFNVLYDTDGDGTPETNPTPSNTVTTTVVEPDLAISKTISTVVTQLDAGDTVTYQIVVQHTGASTADAFDLNLSDIIPAELGSVTLDSAVIGVSDVSGSLTLAGNSLTTTGNLDLLQGQVLTITVSGKVKDAVAPATIISNSATVTYTSLDGVVTGERDGGGGVNDYTETANAPDVTTVGTLQVAKTADKATAAIGDTVTYTVTVTVGEGTTNNLVLNDTLPGGLQFVAGSAVIATNPAGMTITGFDANAVDQTLTVVNPGAVDGAGTLDSASFTITYQAIVLDALANTNNATLVNDLDASADDLPPDNNNQATVTVTEPLLRVTKGASTATPNIGDTITYVLNVTHTVASTSDAFDVLVRDAMPAGFTLNLASISVTGATLEANTSTTAQLDLKLTELALGDSATITFTVTIAANPALVGTDIDNNARIYWDSQAGEGTNTVLAGGTDGDEDRDYGATGPDEVYNIDTQDAQDTERVTINANSLTGLTYEDVNANGAYDAGTDTLLDSVQITLTGTLAAGGAPFTVTTTSVLGIYTFATLPAGTFTLTETQPAGYVDGAETVGTTFGGTVSPALNVNTISGLTIGAGSSSGSGYNFGEVLGSSIAGSVFDDLDNDGVRAGEPGIASVAVQLTGTDFLGQAVNLTATSDGNGNFILGAGNTLRPGTYTLTEVAQPAGFLDGKDTAGTTGGDATTVNDQISGIVLPPGTASTGNIFAELQGASISGFVYIDSDGDGLKGPTETGIQGVKIELTGTDDLGNPVSLTVQTDADGMFIFDTLRPGTYTLTETQPGGYYDDRETLGTAGGDKSVNDVISNIVLTPGSSAQDYLFAEVPIPPVIPPVPEEPRRQPRPEAAPEPFVFAFDSFRNFAATTPGVDLPGISSIDIWGAALLPLAPIYSGAANPGATLVIDIYNANGVHLGSQTVVADTGGNWLANFTSVVLRDAPSEVRITQVNASYSFGSSGGNNLRTYYAPAALNPGHFLGQTIENGLNEDSAPLLGGLDLANPLDLGSRKYGVEFLVAEGTAAGD